MKTTNFGSLRVEQKKFNEAKKPGYGHKLSAQYNYNKDGSKELIDILELNDLDVMSAPRVDKGKYKGPIAYLVKKGTTNSQVLSNSTEHKSQNKIRVSGSTNINPAALLKQLYNKAERNGLIKKLS